MSRKFSNLLASCWICIVLPVVDIAHHIVVVGVVNLQKYIKICIHNLLPFYFALIFVMIWLIRSILCKTSALKNCKIKTKWNFTFVSKSNRCCSVSKLILTRHFLDKIYTNYWDICKISSSRSIITMSSPYLFLSCFQLFSCTWLCNRPSTKNDLLKKLCYKRFLFI